MAGLLDIAQGKKEEKKGPGWFTGFVQSTLSSPLELFGMDPAPEVEQFRRGHPISGLGSELLGTSVPYLGWAGVSRKIGVLDDAVRAIGDAEKAPILTRGAQEIARFAPFEAGRAAIASTLGGENFGNEALQSAFNLVGAGAAGGVFGAFESAGRLIPRKSLAEIAPTVDPDAPLALRLRQLRTAIDQGEVTDNPAALNRFNAWLTDARREVPGYGQRHLGAFEGEGGGQLSRDIERLFFKPEPNVGKAVKEGKPVVVRTFTHSAQGFKDQASWQAGATEAMLPDVEQFPLVGQYFRHVTATTPKAAKTLEAVAGKLTKVGDFHIGREADGNYVVLRKLATVGDEGKKTPVSRWAAYKTDDPAAFSPELRNWQRVDERWKSWLPVDDVDIRQGGSILQAGQQRNTALPMTAYDEMMKSGKLGRALEGFAGPIGENLRQFGEHYLTPSMNQFARNPLANWIFSGTRDLFNLADLKANDALFGQRDLKEAKDIVSAIWAGSRPADAGVVGAIKSLNEDQLKGLFQIIAAPKRLTNEQIQTLFTSGAIDEHTLAAFQTMDKAALDAFGSYAATKKAMGQPLPKSRQGHGGISRYWKGSLKMGLTDEGGNLVAIASGDSVRAVERRAAFIEDRLAAEGVSGLKRGSVWDGQGSAPKELALVQRNPGFLEADRGVRGFEWDFGQHGTKDDLIEAIHRNLQWRYREEASLARDVLYGNQLKQLQETDPRTWNALVERFHQMEGTPGPVTTLINNLVDPVLSPILGKGSAGKIVDAVNKGFWHLQLGAFNLGYPVANMVGILQTVLPEIAFVMGGVPERLAPYYGWQLVKNSAGQSKGLMSFLEPAKILSAGTKALFRPSEELIKFFGRAVNEGVIDPKFLEEFAGQSASRVQSLKSLAKNPGDFPKAVEAISAWMPSASERLTRSMAFSTGYSIGKDVLGLADDSLYMFSKKFTDRTMFQYAMADRANVLTSPAGRLFGSMKNWVSHYISNMMIYAGEAGRGNVAPLAWQMAMTGAVGGLGAVPFAPMIAGAYAQQVEDKKLLEWIYGGMGQRAGDALYMGLPAVLGLSLSSATASPVRDANMLFSFAIQDRAKAMGRSVGAGVDHWLATGEHPARSEIARGSFARAFAPKVLYRGLQVYDNQGLESLTTGYPIIDQVNPWNKVLYTSGFTPVDIERGYLEFEALLKDKGKMQSAISRYGIAMAEALKTGDSDGIDEILGRAMVDGLDVSSVMRSANSRIDKDSKGMLERNFSAAQRSGYSSVIGER